MFEVNTGYYLELLTPEIMKLLESNKSEINKDKNGKYVPNLEITEVIFVHCKIVNNSYQQIQNSCTHLFLINHLVSY